MHTTDTARGEGVGEAMVKYLVGLARQRGYKRVSRETGSQPEFEPARNLYRRTGFRCVRPICRLPEQCEQRLHDAGAPTLASA